MVEVPDIRWEMGSLEYLYMSDVICVKPLKIHGLKYLKTLAYILVYDILGLETMTYMQRLGIEEVDENSDVSTLFALLANLKYISRLTLRGFRFRSMPCLDQIGGLVRLRTVKLDGLLAQLPSANNFPPNIRELSLVNSCLDEDPMPVLEKLPYLTHLNLRNAYTGRQMVIRQDGFPDLKYLCIKEFWNLRNLKVAQVGEGEVQSWNPIRGIKEVGMHYLKQIEIYNCPYLDTLPKDIWRMESLMVFKMVTTKKIATKIRKSRSIPNTMDVDISP